LLIRGRDSTKLIDALEREFAAVRIALTGSGYDQIRIQGARCFTTADLPLQRTQTFRGHLLLYRRALAQRLNPDVPCRQRASSSSRDTWQHSFLRQARRQPAVLASSRTDAWNREKTAGGWGAPLSA
jgi:hypothetical protein